MRVATLWSRLKRNLELHFERAWYGKTGLTNVMRPISWLFCAIVVLRRMAYRLRIFKSERLNVPVIVVGNITVGGTGKTPLVIWLANFLKDKGYKPGIITRGYGGKARNWPQQVRADGDPVVVGDEAILIARRTGLPMAAGPDRFTAGQSLIEFKDCNVIICDDGLQHYRLRRDVEVSVVDGIRRFGNGYCLPAGPLRERPSRLEKVDLIVSNGIASHTEIPMKYESSQLINMLDQKKVEDLSQWKGRVVHAVAGIGNPERFFSQLESAGIEVIRHAFSDHYAFSEVDLDFGDDKQVLMTEKDAVKCQRFAKASHWYVPISVEIDTHFGFQVINKMKVKYG